LDGCFVSHSDRFADQFFRRPRAVSADDFSSLLEPEMLSRGHLTEAVQKFINGAAHTRASHARNSPFWQVHMQYAKCWICRNGAHSAAAGGSGGTIAAGDRPDHCPVKLALARCSPFG
jgi:hypothetical protein